LSLDVVDKLADVLGLQIVVTVGRAKRPTRRGPKPKKEKTVDTRTEWLNRAMWDKFARGLAQDAYRIFDSSRRGIWHLEEVDKLCVYNNHPWTRRDEETATFRRWLTEHGIGELAYATYPETGVTAGTSYAMILDAGGDREDEVAQGLQRIVLKLMDEVGFQVRMMDKQDSEELARLMDKHAKRKSR
jgi:hypothetical protein